MLSQGARVGLFALDGRAEVLRGELPGRGEGLGEGPMLKQVVYINTMLHMCIYIYIYIYIYTHTCIYYS